MDSQSDLEVIVEFLEECYQQNTAEYLQKWSTAGPLNGQSVPSYDKHWTCFESPDIKAAFQPLPSQDVSGAQNIGTLSACGSVPNFESTTQSTKDKCQARATGSGKRVRLFHFLFEMLEDPAMAHCVSWVPAATGVFRFSSTNKDEVAALWGQRKGNKRPMTYQKMSRALRNYARSGEIFKVKKKLTYQFSQDTLIFLQKSSHGPF